MRTQGVIFVGTGVFLVVIGAIYWFTGYEPAGTVMLELCAGLAIIPGTFLLLRSRNAPPAAEDQPTAEPEEGAGGLGTFPESSVWPVVLAGGAAMTGIGLVFGLWSALPGVVLLVAAFVGATLESRGEHIIEK